MQGGKANLEQPWGSEKAGGGSRLPRAMRPQSAATALALIALLAPSCGAAAEDVAELRRMVKELQAQNRQLSQRLGTLESAREPSAASRTRPTSAHERPAPAPIAAQPSTVVVSSQAAPLVPGPPDTRTLSLDQRVQELELQRAAQEQATRQIIQDTLIRTGPKINSFLALSGAIDVVAGRSQDFSGVTKDTLDLGTTELDFDIALSSWLAGSLVLGFERSSFLTSPVTAAPIIPALIIPATVTPTPVVTTPVDTLITDAIDRFTVERANIRVGNLLEFPIAARAGYEALPFGTTTGVARVDTLSIGTPLTTEVFESRQVALGLEFALPTPPLRPPAPPIIVPRAQPQFIAPVVSNLVHALGYRPPPERIARPLPITPVPDLPPFYGSFSLFKGSEKFPNREEIENFNASLGYRTRGHCDTPYEELKSSLVCPWQIDVHVDYNSSVFDSRFLERNYLPFLNQIGRVPGMAASAKASFGPFALVTEVNGAIEKVRLVDGLGIPRNLTPMAWQVSLAYQFDWNPWITEIGAQGSFISVGYSGSKDMAGVNDLISGVPARIGFVPENRLLVTAGEWVMPGLRIALEYSANWDYSIADGGTGRVAHGLFSSVQLNF
jgi:uncharacterized coiled-coil protein SlyX